MSHRQLAQPEQHAFENLALYLFAALRAVHHSFFDLVDLAEVTQGDDDWSRALLGP